MQQRAPLGTGRLRRSASAGDAPLPSTRVVRFAPHAAGGGNGASAASLDEAPEGSRKGAGSSSAGGGAALPRAASVQASLRSEDEALGLSSTEEEELETADEVAQLKAEVTELRQLLIAQARLVQSQQRHIVQMEAAVGQAVVQSTSAVTAAAAAAAQATSRDGAPQAAPSAWSPGVGEPAAAAQQLGSAGSGSLLLESVKAEEGRANRALADAALNDRRLVGLFDARYHSTAWGATPRDFRVLPKRIFLVRHAESEGNVDNIAYTYLPDPRVPLTARGWEQAMNGGERLRAAMDAASEGKPYKLFFYTSPYLRSRQTYEGLAQAFSPEQCAGVQEEVQLREQDFGNFQDAEGKKREKAERLRFGRFFYRFPNGESGADVYDRMTIFEDHLVRDINAGRFADSTSLVLVTHGLALRIFLMRWFHWTVDQFMSVFNPPNAEPLVLERVPSDVEARQGGPAAWIHTKSLYRLSEASREVIKGCTPEMCQTSWAPRGINPLDPADSLLLPDRPPLQPPAAGAAPGGNGAP